MRDFVYGDDFILCAYKGNDYYPFACVEKVSIKMISGLIETTVPHNGAWEHFEMDGRNGWSASLRGVQVLEDEVNNLWFSWETLRLQIRTEGLNLKFIWKDRKGKEKFATGFAQIVDTGMEGESGEFARFDLQLQGSGPLDINGILEPPKNPRGMRIEWTTTGTEPNKLQSNQLIAISKADIMQVSLEGNDVFEVITDGEPSPKQVRLDNVEGSLRWAYDFDSGWSAHCIILKN